MIFSNYFMGVIIVFYIGFSFDVSRLKLGLKFMIYDEIGFWV